MTLHRAVVPCHTLGHTEVQLPRFYVWYKYHASEMAQFTQWVPAFVA